ncbi:hypothetical protein FRX31_016677, partial [Thalictrum thalictroides]
VFNSFRRTTRFSSTPQVDFLTFLASTVDKLDSPNHCWLIKFEESNGPFTRDGVFLVLDDSLVLGSDHVHLFEMVQYLQHR